MDLSSFHNQFREETTENIRILSDGLMALETAGDEAERKAQIDRVFRAMHTIKGSARMLGFEAVGRLAHSLEDLLGELRQGRRTLDRRLADALLVAGDAVLALTIAAVEGRPPPVEVEAAITTLLAGAAPASAPPVEAPPDVAQPTPPPQPPPPPPAAPPPAPAPAAAPAPPVVEPRPAAPAPSRGAGRQTVRVRVDRLDRMLNLAGELVVIQQSLANHAEQQAALQLLVERQSRALAALEDELERLRFSQAQRQRLDQRLRDLHQAADGALELAHRQNERFTRHSSQHNLLVTDLQQEVMAARLLPIGTVYTGLPRSARDMAQTTGKELRLELHGETVELDRKVLELLNDPLMHLVRNALDHGIELPAEREAAGKARQGVVEIRAEAVGDEVQLTISDDGRGMDPQRLRERAIQLGLITSVAASLLSDAEALELIFFPGFSTAAMVTDISGRGVGMDVVRTNMAELGGQVRVESQLHVGSKITLMLPLTLVTTRVLLARVGRLTFALPASGCYGATWVKREQLQALEGQPTIEVEGHTVSVLTLADLIGVEAPSPLENDARAPALLVGSAQRPVALLVDELLDEREAVVKPLDALLNTQRHYAGAVQLGDGALILLLNLLQVMQGARGTAPSRAAPAEQRRSRLLVVDDSFTTRELIRSILQSAGYEVAVAVDGANALERLRAQPCDLVVSDVEMPRLDGFQLTSSLRSDQTLHELPVVLITSLASEEHRRRGLEVGAQAYIVKSQFNQESLLDVIRQLLGVHH